MTSPVSPGRVALVGLGEVGRILAEDLPAAGLGPLAAWDTAFADPGSRASRNAAGLGLEPSPSSGSAVEGAELVVSAVTAASCVAAAEAAAPALAPGAWFVDLNSASPGHKAAAAQVVEASGARYVEAALMSPIGPRRSASPFLLGGPHAGTFAEHAPRFGLSGVQVASDVVGRAAATKLCRSVIVKGLESLFGESMLAARHYGVEADVIGSLSNILPEADWERIAGYFVSRSVEHGVRRAEEMAEAAATVEEAGVDPWMSLAAVQRQRWAAGLGVTPMQDLVPLIDAMRRAAGLDLGEPQ
ncbi:DUF1932 domain-containing protein [Actinotalea sp. M2MS4P-6]|uniref:NAD(P)-dependent oxidoreductase n=1 Tax=Actinotalea sp. M2MS4P-6 TaxID=2983762 RepID=UPI0021E4CC16|nr:NAD(P)-dependent oxidoreductase [Actinotalea sp. M2MS4P-6]MCV2394325.1 DUF1932 domain-containing protein [Actinotalea sp. M2MS4P-6]